MYKAYPSDLKKWMAEKRKDCQMVDIIRICYEISCGVLHLWNHGVVHRDLRLNNILIDDEGHIVITGFGVAVKFNSKGKIIVDSPGGNQEHLAPEVLNTAFYLSRRKTIKIDYSKQPSFALGVLFHEILTGSHPFDNYPSERQYGERPNLSLPPLGIIDTIEGVNNKNLVIDDELTLMIRDLLLPPANRMTLKDCNDILNKLFRSK